MNFVTDRNLMDISVAKDFISKIHSFGFDSLTELEKAQWNAGLKGFLNYSDLNRIESNTAEIASLINVVIEEVKTDWSMTDIPTISDFQRILNNVGKIRSSPWHNSNTPDIPSFPVNTYSKINDIEKILLDAYTVFTRYTDSISYIGEIYIDEEIGEL